MEIQLCKDGVEAISVYERLPTLTIITIHQVQASMANTVIYIGEKILKMECLVFLV